MLVILSYTSKVWECNGTAHENQKWETVFGTVYHFGDWTTDDRAWMRDRWLGSETAIKAVKKYYFGTP